MTGRELQIGTRIAFVAVLFAGHVQPSGAQETDGAKLYYSLCASCHGPDAKGNGPVAKSLRTPPPDLTTITHRFDGRFPSEYVWQTIDGRAKTAAHGPREMPVWGRSLFFSHDPLDWKARGRAEEMITALAEYLRSIQVPSK